MKIQIIPQTINEWISTTMWIVLLIAIIYLQITGYYNRVYIEVKDCDGIIAIQKTTEMEFNKQLQIIKIPRINKVQDISNIPAERPEIYPEGFLDKNLSGGITIK